MRSIPYRYRPSSANGYSSVWVLNFQENSWKSTLWQIVLVAALVTLIAGSFAGMKTVATASTPAYDNLQVFLSPQNSSLTTFSVNVYNTTGGLVATSQSSYPAFSFELPSSNYLLTATAGSPNYGIISPVAQSTGAASPGAIIAPYRGDEQEYGYSQVTLNGSQSLTISTSELGSVNTSQISVQVNFANGTAATNADVYASPLGGDYWYLPGSAISMSNQTASDGTATLVVPDVPIQVTSWDWVAVNLPENQTTTTVTVAGQPVNVTVNWQPTYVGLAGSALIIPPFQPVSITLKAQQQNFWAYPEGVASTQTSLAVPGLAAAGSPGTVANSPSAIPASVLEQQGTSGSQRQSTPAPSPPAVTVTMTTTQLATSPTTVSPSSASSNGLLIDAGVVVAIVVSAAAVLVAVRRK